MSQGPRKLTLPLWNSFQKRDEVRTLAVSRAHHVTPSPASPSSTRGRHWSGDANDVGGWPSLTTTDAAPAPCPCRPTPWPFARPPPARERREACLSHPRPRTSRPSKRYVTQLDPQIQNEGRRKGKSLPWGQKMEKSRTNVLSPSYETHLSRPRIR